MERNVKLKIRIDYKAMKYYNMYNLIYRKKFVWFYIGLALVCLAASLSSIFINKNTVLAVVFGLFALYLIYQTFNLEKLIDRNITGYFYNRRPIEQDLSVNDESLTVTNPKDPSKFVTYDWLQVTMVHEIPQYFYLFMGKQPLIIEKNPESIIEGTYQDLLDIIMEKASGKPYKKVEKNVVKKPITFVHPEFDEEEVQEADLTSGNAHEEAEEIRVEVQEAQNVEEAGNSKEEE
jgi:hypothetical protein